MSTIHQQIIDSSNISTMNKAQEKPTYSQSVSGDDFLLLMTEQLKYQDPTDPMDNNDMLAQEAQFQSLSQLESLSSNFSKFSNIFQANSLIGQNVEVSVDDKTYSGTVDYVDFSDVNGASISINNRLYPLSSITKVYPGSSPVPNKNEGNNTDDATLGEKLLSSISSNIEKLTNKVVEYIKTEDNQ